MKKYLITLLVLFNIHSTGFSINRLEWEPGDKSVMVSAVDRSTGPFFISWKKAVLKILPFFSLSLQ